MHCNTALLRGFLGSVVPRRGWFRKFVDGRPARLCENSDLGERQRMEFSARPSRCHPVMAGLVPAIHDLRGFNRLKSWMTGTRPVMTEKQWSPSPRVEFPSPSRRRQAVSTRSAGADHDAGGPAMAGEGCRGVTVPTARRPGRVWWGSACAGAPGRRAAGPWRRTGHPARSGRRCGLGRGPCRSVCMP